MARRMALGATIYRVAMELSDIDRGIYETLDLRLAQHPSEDNPRLVARILAYALLFEDGLEFGKGLSSSEEPALWTHDLTGQLLHWVDVGTPSAERIHSASKRTPRVSIVGHQGIDGLRREMQRRAIHRAEQVNVILLDVDLVGSLANAITRNSEWSLMRNDESLIITMQGEEFSGGARKIPLPQP